MELKKRFIEFSINYPKSIISFFILATLVSAFFIPNISIDTDPENMLSEDTHVRMFHSQVKEEFSLYDMLVLGVVNEKNEYGVFNPKTLSNIFMLTSEIKKTDGVIKEDIISPSTQDNIEQAGLGTVRFEWLMPSPPQNQKEALKIRDNIMSNPTLNGTMVSEDGKALAIYIPLESKDLSYEMSKKIEGFISKLEGDDSYYISGLPVAEDTFGVQMFKQMGASAPLAMLIIFILLKIFFKKTSLIISPMIIALMSVIVTMGLLIGMGYKVHIMSSMIPIFLMPIAVTDSVHILSEFYDLYPKFKDKKNTLIQVMTELFIPMLYTSLTTCVGFASLALTPIPPVRIFGLFVSFGIGLAWILTVTFIPAYIMVFVNEKSLENFGTSDKKDGRDFLGYLLEKNSRMVLKNTGKILFSTLFVVIISFYGLTKIVINDNPVKWFEENHPIRIADTVLNNHFGGTYMAYIVWEKNYTMDDLTLLKNTVKKDLEGFRQGLADNDYNSISQKIETEFKAAVQSKDYSAYKFISAIKSYVSLLLDSNYYFELEDFYYILDDMESSQHTFKKPDVLSYMDRLKEAVTKHSSVGKVNSISDIVKKIYMELLEGKQEFYRIPDTSPAVAQSLISLQNSHNPNLIWHFVNPSYQKSNMWIQLKNGDNQSMQEVKRYVEEWVAKNPAPENIKLDWAGLTYVNVVWQDEMVKGMLKSLLGSFVIVFLMMCVLFKSPIWGVLSMIPLSVTVLFSYGMIGIAGKSYDMPVAVLSSLTLGLSVDFAIHFIQRLKEIYAEDPNWESAIKKMFTEPARAISRNALIISIAFLPLVVAPLIPYKTVGILISTILIISSMATLIILPASIDLLKKYLFKK